MSSVVYVLISGGKSAASTKTGESNPDTHNVWATRPMVEILMMDGEVVWEVGGIATMAKRRSATSTHTYGAAPARVVAPPALP